MSLSSLNLHALGTEPREAQDQGIYLYMHTYMIK